MSQTNDIDDEDYDVMSLVWYGNRQHSACHQSATHLQPLKHTHRRGDGHTHTHGHTLGRTKRKRADSQTVKQWSPCGRCLAVKSQLYL